MYRACSPAATKPKLSQGACLLLGNCMVVPTPSNPLSQGGGGLWPVSSLALPFIPKTPASSEGSEKHPTPIPLNTFLYGKLPW